MATLQEQGLAKLWTRTKSYINNRLRAFNFNGVVRETLLWENPNTNVAFMAQTIALDLSKYDGVKVISLEAISIVTATSVTTHTSYIPKGLRATNNFNYNNRCGRDITPSDTGVTFGAGYAATVSGNMSTNNSNSIPYKIYGIKVNRTANVTDEAVVITDVLPLERGGLNAMTASGGRATLELSGATTETLLWTNANIGSFAEQTLSFDLTNFEFVEIFYSISQNDSRKNSIKVRKQVDCMISGTYGGRVAERFVTISDSGLSFGGGIFYNVYGTAINNRNDFVIPTKIYGIKVVS